MRGVWSQRLADRLTGRFANPFRGWAGRFESVTGLLIWLNVAVFILQLVGMLFRTPVVEELFALSARQLRRGFIWQPLTYMFLHDPGNIFHILVNMFVLWFFGREVEYFIGARPFARLYLFGGLAGAALWLTFNLSSQEYVLGASAAVLSCVIAFAALFPNREITLLVFFVLPVTLKAKHMALIAVALDVVPLVSQRVASVAHLAHLGGMLVGYLYIKELGYGTTPRWMLAFQRVGAALTPRSRPRRRDLSPDESRSERDEYMREVVDPILDKIAREGMQSLTRRERQILESARGLIEKKGR
jgi:membrane associated rhomboid family serine protease